VYSERYKKQGSILIDDPDLVNTDSLFNNVEPFLSGFAITGFIRFSGMNKRRRKKYSCVFAKPFTEPCWPGFPTAGFIKWVKLPEQ